jgi:hypothetical protein
LIDPGRLILKRSFLNYYHLHLLYLSFCVIYGSKIFSFRNYVLSLKFKAATFINCYYNT